MRSRGLGVRGRMGLVVISALVGVGCAGEEELPRVGTLGDEPSGGGADGSDLDGTGGADPDGSGGTNGGTGNTGGGTETEDDEVPHAVYLYAAPAGEDLRHVCELSTGVVVGTSAVNYSDTIGVVHPLTDEVWTLDGGTGLVKDIQAHPDACSGWVEDFSFHPTTGALASDCGEGWYDETGALTVRPAKFRDEAGRFFHEGELFDAEGTAVPLETSLSGTSFVAVHSRPGGGFFAVTLGDPNEITRYTIHGDGAVDVVATTNSAGLDVIAFGAAIDALGGVWFQGPSAAHPDGSIVRLSSDFSRAEVIYSTGECDLTDYWGLVFSTP